MNRDSETWVIITKDLISLEAQKEERKIMGLKRTEINEG